MPTPKERTNKISIRLVQWQKLYSNYTHVRLRCFLLWRLARFALMAVFQSHLLAAYLHNLSCTQRPHPLLPRLLRPFLLQQKQRLRVPRLQRPTMSPPPASSSITFHGLRRGRRWRTTFARYTSLCVPLMAERLSSEVCQHWWSWPSFWHRPSDIRLRGDCKESCYRLDKLFGGGKVVNFILNDLFSDGSHSLPTQHQSGRLQIPHWGRDECS